MVKKLDSIYKQKTETVHERSYKYKMEANDSMLPHIAKEETLSWEIKNTGDNVSNAHHENTRKCYQRNTEMYVKHSVDGGK